MNKKFYLFILATMVAVNAFGYEKQTWNYETGAKLSTGSSVVHALDIYYPETGEAPYPVLIYVGASAWLNPNYKTFAYNEASAFLEYALQHGYAVVCPNNRIPKDASYPASLHDIKAVVRFLHNNGEWDSNPRDIDTSFIAVSGFNEGSYMAMHMGLTRNKQIVSWESWEGNVGNFTGKSSSVDAVVDFQCQIALYCEDASQIGCPSCTTLQLWYKQLFSVNGFKDIAPTMIVSGKQQAIIPAADIAEVVRLMKENLKLGDDCEYYEYKGAFGIPTDNVSHEAIMNFLDRIRAKKATSDIEQITDRQVSGVQKITKDAQILILRGEKTYTLQGQEVK